MQAGKVRFALNKAKGKKFHLSTVDATKYHGLRFTMQVLAFNDGISMAKSHADSKTITHLLPSRLGYESRELAYL